MWGKSLLYNLFISVFQVLGCTAQGIGPNAQNLRWSRLRVRQWQWGWRSHAARRKHHGWSTDKAREKFGWAELHTGSIQGMMEDVRALVEYAMPSELQLGMGLGPGPGKRRQFKAPTWQSVCFYMLILIWARFIPTIPHPRFQCFLVCSLFLGQHVTCSSVFFFDQEMHCVQATGQQALWWAVCLLKLPLVPMKASLLVCESRKE